MGNPTKITLKSLLGSACGAISGALLLAVPTYLSTETGFLGPESAWWPLAAIAGGVLGIVPGALIGFLVAKYRLNKRISLIVGTAVGVSMLVGFLIFDAGTLADWEVFQTALASPPIGALIGFIVSTTNRRTDRAEVSPMVDIKELEN